MTIYHSFFLFFFTYASFLNRYSTSLHLPIPRSNYSVPGLFIDYLLKFNFLFLFVTTFFKFFLYLSHRQSPILRCIVLASSIFNCTNLDLFRYPISVFHLFYIACQNRLFI